MDLSHIWYPSYGHLGERGTIIGYYNTGANADAYAALTPRERETRAVAQGVKIHGAKYRTELATSFSHHWRQTPYLEASWHSLSGGPDAPAFAPLNRPAGHVYFMRRLPQPHRRLAARGVHLGAEGGDGAAQPGPRVTARERDAGGNAVAGRGVLVQEHEEER